MSDATRATRQQVIEVIERIAAEWDGCEHDETMTDDIGEAIRCAGRKFVNNLFAELADGVR